MEEIELPPWFHQDGGRRKRNARSQAQEKKRASEVGGRVQPGSGSGRTHREDVRSSDALEQLKTTEKDRYPLTVDECLSVEAHALLSGREPTLLIDFVSHGIRVICAIERIP